MLLYLLLIKVIFTVILLHVIRYYPTLQVRIVWLKKLTTAGQLNGSQAVAVRGL